MFAVWDRLLASCVDQGEAELAAALTACRLTIGKGNTLILSAMESRDTLVLAQDATRIEAFIAGALSRLMGSSIAIEIHMQKETGSAARRGRYRDAESHPLVQKLMDTFDAEVLAFEPMDKDTWHKELQRLCGDIIPDSPASK